MPGSRVHPGMKTSSRPRSLVHSPAERSLVVLGYPDIPSSGDDMPWLMGFEPIGCEFTSRHVVDNMHAKGFDFGGEDRLPPGDAWVLLEFGGDTKGQPAHWGDGEVLEHDAQAEGGQVVADVLGAERQGQPPTRRGRTRRTRR
jgi:hypothetical protein